MQNNAIEYRILTPDDIDAVVAFGAEAAKTINSWGEIDEDTIRRSLSTMIMMPNFWLMGVFVDDVFKGGMAGNISQAWFSKRFESSGITIFLDKSIRGRGIAQELYNMFDEWANKFNNVTHGELRTTSGADITPLVTRNGYVKTGSTYRKVYIK
jgi:GNAT superfamily N-acetyltransferase